MADGGITVALVSAGIICLIAAVIGGGLKGLGFDMPALQSVARQTMLALLGIVLLGAGLALRGGDASPKTEAKAGSPAPVSTASMAPATNAPAATNPAPAGPWLQAQKWLKRLGYYSGPLDGLSGAQTSQAIRAFQLHAQLPPDGLPGAQTLSALHQQAMGL